MCNVCYRGATCVCRLHLEWVVVPFHARKYSVFGYCVNSCGGCRHGTVRTWCSPLAVGLRSSLMRLCGARGHQRVFVASVQPAFLRYVFKLLFQCFSRRTFLSCCTTRAKAMGVTERSRRYVYFNCWGGRAIRLISLNTCGLDSLLSLDMFRVEGERVSCQRVVYLMH